MEYHHAKKLSVGARRRKVEEMLSTLKTVVSSMEARPEGWSTPEVLAEMHGKIMDMGTLAEVIGEPPPRDPGLPPNIVSVRKLP